MSALSFDVVFVGSGPVVTLAIQGAQLGLKTAVVEKDKKHLVEPVWMGCILVKPLGKQRIVFMVQHDFSNHGVKLQQVQWDLAAMLGRKEKIQKDLTRGISFCSRKIKLKPFVGGKNSSSRSCGSHSWRWDKNEIAGMKSIICATGSVVTELPSWSLMKKNWSSTGPWV